MQLQGKDIHKIRNKFSFRRTKQKNIYSEAKDWLKIKKKVKQSFYLFQTFIDYPLDQPFSTSTDEQNRVHFSNLQEQLIPLNWLAA